MIIIKLILFIALLPIISLGAYAIQLSEIEERKGDKK